MKKNKKYSTLKSALYDIITDYYLGLSYGELSDKYSKLLGKPVKETVLRTTLSQCGATKLRKIHKRILDKELVAERDRARSMIADAKSSMKEAAVKAVKTGDISDDQKQVARRASEALMEIREKKKKEHDKMIEKHIGKLNEGMDSIAIDEKNMQSYSVTLKNLDEVGRRLYGLDDIKEMTDEQRLALVVINVQKGDLEAMREVKGEMLDDDLLVQIPAESSE